MAAIPINRRDLYLVKWKEVCRLAMTSIVVFAKVVNDTVTHTESMVVILYP